MKTDASAFNQLSRSLAVVWCLSSVFSGPANNCALFFFVIHFLLTLSNIYSIRAVHYQYCRFKSQGDSIKIILSKVT